MKRIRQFLGLSLCLIMITALCPGASADYVNYSGSMKEEPKEENYDDVSVFDELSTVPFDGNWDGLYLIPFKRTVATSELTEDGVRFPSDNLNDMDIDTCWAEGAEGSGEGESVILSYDNAQEVSVLFIVPGFTGLYRENARPKVLEFSFSGGYSFRCAFPDKEASYAIKLSRPIITDYVQITIISSYEGERCEDCCISDLRAYGKGQRYAACENFWSVDFDRVTSSSTLKADGFTYYAEKAVDGRPHTCWQEAAKGTGRGESITGYFDESKYISAVGILPGYFGSYEENCRPRDISLYFSEGESLQVTVPDEKYEFVVRFPEPVKTDYIKLVIESSYKGSLHEDCCISEFTPYVISD